MHNGGVFAFTVRSVIAIAKSNDPLIRWLICVQKSATIPTEAASLSIDRMQSWSSSRLVDRWNGTSHVGLQSLPEGKEEEK